MKAIKTMGPSSRCVHAGAHPEPATGAIMTPIFATSTYVQGSPGVHKGYEYSRSQNPTRAALEEAMATLEGGARGFAFASGLAAAATVLETLDSGARVVAMDDMYGGTFRLLENVRKRSAALEVVYADLTDTKRAKEAITPETDLIWIETPTNPMLKIVDLKAISEIARSRGAITVCDSTFATPVLQKPFDFGIDLVVHSATKYLGGHSDVVGGIVVARRAEELAEKVGFLQNAVGAVMGPFDAFLVHRGIKTLALRMERHTSNAGKIARFLSDHKRIRRVYYPGLEDHPGHDIAARQMSGFGGMISAELEGGLEASRSFLEKTELFSLAESLGGVESLIEHPAIMTHASVPPKTRQQLGISDGLVRLSVGIEDTQDLIADLDRALT